MIRVRQGDFLLFSSDRNNHTNLFGVDLESGDIEQLSDLEPVPLPRELEFLRACKNPVREPVYFWHDTRLLALDVGDGGGVIRMWKWVDRHYLGPRILCEHDSAMRIQQTHPHPRISPDGQYVVFTSDRSGYGNVYMVPVVDFDELPPVDD